MTSRPGKVAEPRDEAEMDPASSLLAAASVLLGSSLLVALAGLGAGFRRRRRQRIGERLRAAVASSAGAGDKDWLELSAGLGAAAADPQDLPWVLELLEATLVAPLGPRAAAALEDLVGEPVRRPGSGAARRRRRRFLGNLLILQESPAPELLATLVPCLHDSDPAVAGSAALAVGHHPESYPGAAVPLATALGEASPPRRSAQALQAQAWALGRLLAAHPGLIPVVADDPAPAVRRLAVRAAGRCGEEPSLAAALGAVIEGGARDGDETVRRVALEAARRLPEERRRRLAEPALGDGDAAVRQAAAGALAAGEGESVALLVDALPAAEEELRRHILTALEESQGGVPDGVWEKARQGSGEARRWAVEALGVLGGGPEVPPLAAFLGAADAEVRVAAAGALATIARRGAAGAALAAAVPAILGPWHRQVDARAILALAEALAASGDQEAKAAILHRLSSVAAPVRERLLEILAHSDQSTAGA